MKTQSILRLYGLTCLLALAVAPVASAGPADRAGSWETRLGIIFQNSSDWDFEGGTTADIKSDSTLLLGIAYHYTDSLEFGGNINFGQTDYTADIAGDLPGQVFGVRGEYESTSLMFDATWNMLDSQFTPFVSAIAGWAWIDTNIADGPPQTGCWWDPWYGHVCANFQDTRSIDGLGYGFDVGARYDISETFAMRATYGMRWVDLSHANGTPDIDGFSLAIGWKF
jgi:Outer membrane protein beta-barrel domain